MRYACAVQGSLSMKEMLAFVVQRCPRAPARDEPANSAWAAQPIHSRKADGRFRSQEVQVRPDLVLQQLRDLAVIQQGWRTPCSLLKLSLTGDHTDRPGLCQDVIRIADLQVVDFLGCGWLMREQVKMTRFPNIPSSKSLVA